MQVVTDDADMPLAFALARGTFATATATATAIKVYPDLDLNLVGKITTEARQSLICKRPTRSIALRTHSRAASAGIAFSWAMPLARALPSR